MDCSLEFHRKHHKEQFYFSVEVGDRIEMAAKKISSFLMTKKLICLERAKGRYGPALKPGWVVRVTFSPGHPGPTRFTNYPGLTRIGSREKRNCSFDDVETYKCYHVALS